MIVRERRLPAILALHRPGISGRALPAHVHAVIFLRELQGSDFGAFCKPMTEPTARAALAAEWALWRRSDGLA